MKACCYYAPTVFSDGKWSCSECGTANIPELNQMSDDTVDITMPSLCTCGSEKSGFPNCHVDWCDIHKVKKD